MAEKHPYSPGGSGAITTAVQQFRSSLPNKLTAETLKKLGIAPNNESYIINIFRFLGVIDTEGNKTQKAATAFSKDDGGFQEDFAGMIRDAYAGLFGLHHESAWTLPENKLVAFFRTSDQTSALTGKRQAVTFQTLAALAGQGAPPSVQKPRLPKKKNRPQAKAPAPNSSGLDSKNDHRESGGNDRLRDVGLTVRVEVNLPASADQETYDRIFRSIRENLLNAK